jgi:phosphatidylglycerophosphate synthase
VCRPIAVGAIAEIYSKTRKVPDLFWNTYVCRPPAAAVVWALSNTRITPNQVTLSAFALAAVSAALIVTLPGHLGLFVAIVVFELSYVLDCADGMLARLRNVQSTPGHLLDFLMDEIKAFLILGAVAVRLYLEQHDPRFLLLGIAGLVALAAGIAITTFQRRPEIAGQPAAGTTSPPSPSLVRRAISLVESGAKFLIHYPSYILYAALIGRIEIYFFPYIAVNALYALRALAWVAVRFGRR